MGGTNLDPSPVKSRLTKLGKGSPFPGKLPLTKKQVAWYKANGIDDPPIDRRIAGEDIAERKRHRKRQRRAVEQSRFK